MRVNDHHAILELHDDGRLFIVDRNTTHGTFVNGYQIQKNTLVPIYRGDEITFGGVESLNWNIIPQKPHSGLHLPHPVKIKLPLTWIITSIAAIIVIGGLNYWFFLRKTDTPQSALIDSSQVNKIISELKDSLSQNDTFDKLDIKHNNLATVKLYVYEKIKIRLNLTKQKDTMHRKFTNADFGIFTLPVATGSGFLLNQKGYVLTNYHVVEKAEEIWVKFSDNTLPVQGKIINTFSDKDISIIKIPDQDAAGRKTVVFPVGDTLLSQGDDVYIIGYPGILDRKFDYFLEKIYWEMPTKKNLSLQKSFDYIFNAINLRYQKIETSVTKGIVSQSEMQDDNNLFVVIDAILNPGNSGGPLFSKTSGLLVGMNTSRGEQSEVANIGLAIHYIQLKQILKQNDIDIRMK